MMGLIGSHESKSDRLVSVNRSSIGEETKEKCESESHSNIWIFLFFPRHGMLRYLDNCLTDSLMNQ